MKTYQYFKYDSNAKATFSAVALLNANLNQAEQFSRYLTQNNLNWNKWVSAVICTFQSKGWYDCPLNLYRYAKVNPFNSIHSELTKVISASVYSMLNLTTDSEPLDAKEYLVTEILRVRLHTSYYFAKSLESILSPDESKKLWMNFVDSLTLSRPSTYRLEQPKDMLFANGQPDQIFEKSFNANEFELEDGRAGLKISRCKWNEVIRECEDPSYGYAIACHYDFEAFKKVNPDFVLTRNQTILMGADHCDFCIHSKMTQSSLVHPDKEFWKKL